MLTNCKNNPMSIEDIHGLLIIDWWQDVDSNTAWSQQAKSELDKLHHHSVIVSNFEITPDLDDPCQFNTIEQYGWHDYQPVILSPLLKECGRRSTNRYVKDRFKSKSFQLNDISSIKLHLKLAGMLNIKNWLIVGGSWGSCIHNRPVGFLNLLNLECNFFITDWSIYRRDFIFTRDCIEKDTLNWIDHGNNLYQLDNLIKRF